MYSVTVSVLLSKKKMCLREKEGDAASRVSAEIGANTSNTLLF